MTLRVLRYSCFCGHPEEIEFRRAQAQRELESLVPEDLQHAVSWQEYGTNDSDGDTYWAISWSIRMDDNDLLRPLDD